jgi:hypothetical protein
MFISTPFGLSLRTGRFTPKRVISVSPTRETNARLRARFHPGRARRGSRGTWRLMPGLPRATDARDERNNPSRRPIDNHQLIANKQILVAAIAAKRISDLRRKVLQLNIARNAAADDKREIDFVHLATLCLDRISRTFCAVARTAG